MDFFGISWSAAGIGFGIATVLLSGLFLLKPRNRRVQVPSVMLFASAQVRAKLRDLFRRPSRLLHFLLLTLMLAAGAAALTDPFPATGKSESALVVAAPEAQEEALRFAARFHPRRIRLAGTEVAGVTDRVGAMWSAMHAPFPDGSRPETILFFAQDSPPWLPENGVWIQTGGDRETPKPPPPREPAYRIFLESATRDKPPMPQGLIPSDTPVGADAILLAVPETSEQWAELFRQLRARHGAYSDSSQHLDAPPTSVQQLPAGNRSSFVPAGALWLLTILIFLLDCRLYSMRKVV